MNPRMMKEVEQCGKGRAGQLDLDIGVAKAFSQWGRGILALSVCQSLQGKPWQGSSGSLGDTG